MSQASCTSRMAILSKRPLASSFFASGDVRTSLYRLLPVMAFSKMAGVGVDPPESVVINILFQSAAGEQVSADVIHPRGLSVGHQPLQWVRSLPGAHAWDRRRSRHTGSPYISKASKLYCTPQRVGALLASNTDRF